MPLTEISNSVVISAESSAEKDATAARDRNQATTAKPADDKPPVFPSKTKATTVSEVGYNWSVFLCQPLKGPLTYIDVPYFVQASKGRSSCLLCDCIVYNRSEKTHCQGKNHREAYKLLGALYNIHTSLPVNPDLSHQRKQAVLLELHEISSYTSMQDRQLIYPLMVDFLMEKDPEIMFDTYQQMQLMISFFKPNSYDIQKSMVNAKTGKLPRTKQVPSATDNNNWTPFLCKLMDGLLGIEPATCMNDFGHGNLRCHVCDCQVSSGAIQRHCVGKKHQKAYKRLQTLDIMTTGYIVDSKQHFYDCLLERTATLSRAQRSVLRPYLVEYLKADKSHRSIQLVKIITSTIWIYMIQKQRKSNKFVFMEELSNVTKKADTSQAALPMEIQTANVLEEEQGTDPDHEPSSPLGFVIYCDIESLARIQNDDDDDDDSSVDPASLVTPRSDASDEAYWSMELAQNEFLETIDEEQEKRVHFKEQKEETALAFAEPELAAMCRRVVAVDVVVEKDPSRLDDIRAARECLAALAFCGMY